MARKVVSPKSSGGGGYNFEDEVSAWWVLHLLSGHTPLDIGVGAPRCIKFQARVDGWLVDDLVAEFAPRGGPVRAAISVKSGDVLKASRVHREFVRDCWELHLSSQSTVFDAARDWLVLASAELTRQQRKTVDDALERAAQQSPEMLDERLQKKNWCSQEVRTFIQSFACPADLTGAHPVHGRHVGALLKTVRILDFDFTRPDSRSRAEALRLCRAQVDSGREEDGRMLWEALLSFVKELRASAGEVTLGSILKRLNGRVRLKHHPDHAPDWERLGKLTARWVMTVRSTIGGIHLPREKPRQALSDALHQHRAVVILGESGIGKSALLKALQEEGSFAGPCYGLHADEVARIDEGTLVMGPSQPLHLLVATQPAARALLCLDGLERLSRPQEFESVARVIQALHLRELGSPWHLLITCQRAAWDGLREELRTRGADLSLISPFTLERLDGPELQSLSRQVPVLASLLARQDLHPLVGNAKMLDLLAVAAVEGSLPNSAKWRGESSLIDWYWRIHLRSGGRDLRTPMLLEELSSRQADARQFSTALSDFSEEQLQVVPNLLRLGVLSEQENTLRFTHDLHADYARQRRLLGWLQSGSLDRVLNRAGNPLWHRAIRLLGLHLLESSLGMGERRMAAWRDLLQEMEAQGAGSGTGTDLLMEALAFTPHPGPLLDELFPEALSEREVALLRRFLVRFFYTTTTPYPILMERIGEGVAESYIEAFAFFRVPDLDLGLPVIKWVARRWEHFYQTSPDELIMIATAWHRAWNKLDPEIQRSMDAMVLSIAEWTHEQGRPPRTSEDRPWVYTLAMVIGPRAPERTHHLIRRLAGRPTEGKGAASGDAPDTWPDGPLHPPDEFFREALLIPWGAASLAVFDPALAQEILLAMLIEYPRIDANNTSLHGWGLYPVQLPNLLLPDFAPVQQLLKHSSKDGVELVLRLIDFVTEQEKQDFITDDESASFPGLSLTIGGETHTYLGNENVFGWHKNTSRSRLVTAILMTLEDWLYKQMDQQELSSEFLKSLLTSTHSVAIIGVLMEVALKYPELLEGPLEPLVEKPELYQWTQSREALAQLEWMLEGNEPSEGREESTSWHQMPHRAQTLLNVVAELYARRGWKWPAVEQLLCHWSTFPEARTSPLLRKELPALLNRDNFKTTMAPNGHTHIEFIPPDELIQHEEAVRQSHKGMAESLLSSILGGARFHGILNGKEQISEEELKELLEEAKDSIGREDSRHLLKRCGAAAVAIIRFPSYLRAHPIWKQQCRDWLVAACSSMNSSPLSYDPKDYDIEAWSQFCAEALPVLWHEQPEDPDLRRALASLVGAQESETVLRLFGALARHRANHREDFLRLLHLAVWFSRAIVIVGTGESHETVQAMEEVLDQQRTDFVNRSLPLLPTNWPAIASLWPEELARFIQGNGSATAPQGLHITYLLSAWSWLYLEAGSKTALDRAFLIDSVESLESLMPTSLYRTRTEAAELAPHIYRAPSFSMERTYLPGISALYTLYATEAATRRRLSEPWMRLPPARHEWTSAFLEALYQLGLSGSGESSIIPKVFSELLDHALDSEVAPSIRSGQVLRALLGCSEEHTLRLWSAQHGSLVHALRISWSRWVEHVLADPESTTAFLSLLQTPAARTLRVEALRWFTRAASLQWLQGDTTAHSSAREMLIQLLELIWNEHQGELKRQHEIREAFDALLSVLLGLQNGRAIILSQRIGSSTKRDMNPPP